ncbi:hypothetical protein [Enterobacter ludwigii]|uniref:hypothetical protein n=1 Tax=Enterobacter ludwigii TaxID=299767 RepID=UPI002E293345|nr:hypothetical protein [Enterobacter ludwigii]MED5697729.1 hypothetical protein [Enterobacter ludwigii]
MTANKPMTGEQLDELMTVAVNMQRDSEKAGDRPTAMFAYAVQVAVMELRKVRTDCVTLAVENAGLKAGASYFSYGSEHNFEWHKTAKEAVEAAEAAIDDYRGDACDGWSEEVDSVCWGIIMQSSTKVGERPRNQDDSCDPAIVTICDYALLPNIEPPATDDFMAEVQASAIDKLVSIKTKQLADMHPDTHAFGANAMSIRSQINELQVFAAELRKGVQS